MFPCRAAIELYKSLLYAPSIEQSASGHLQPHMSVYLGVSFESLRDALDTFFFFLFPPEGKPW